VRYALKVQKSCLAKCSYDSVVLIHDDKHDFCVVAGNDGGLRASTNGYFRLRFAHHAGDNSSIESLGRRVVHRSQQTPRIGVEIFDGFQEASSDAHRRKSLQEVSRTAHGHSQPPGSRHFKKRNRKAAGQCLQNGKVSRRSASHEFTPITKRCLCVISLIFCKN
jgi:hypothetical protein